MDINSLTMVLKGHIANPRVNFENLTMFCLTLRDLLGNPYVPLIDRARLINLLDQAQRRRRELGNAAAF